MATKAVGQITVFDYSDGYSVMLTNPSYTFIGDEDSVRGVQSVTTRVVAMQGASQINASVDTSQIIKPAGFTVTSNGATPSPTLTIQANQSVTDAGVLTIPVTVATGVTVSLQWSYSIAFTGGKGDTGDAGRGVTGTTVQYAPGTLPTTPPSSGWDDTVPSVDEGKYLWVKTVFTYSSGDPVTTYSVAKQGEKGSTGNGVSSTVVEYAESTSGVTPPATIASWGSDIPNVAQGNYLWTRTTTNYTGSNPTVSYSVARIGMDGEPATTYSLIVSHAAIVKSASGTFSPTSITLTAKSQTGTNAYANYSGRFKIEVYNGSSWSTKYTSSSNENTKSYTIPSGTTQVRCSLYLAGGTSTLLDQQTVPVVSDGTSVTINTKSVTYQKGTSGTTAPTGTWSSTIPSDIGEGEYLWTKTSVTYSDGNNTEAYSVSRYAINGTQGAPGNSPTVSTTVVEYAESTSGTSHPTSGWDPAPPSSVTPGSYMWTKTTVTYSDSAVSVSYTVSRNGSDGDDAYTIILDNESHTFPGGTSAAIAGTATVNVYAYKGTTAIAPTVTKSSITGLPTGMTVKTVTNDSTNKKSTIVFQVTTSMVTRSGLVTIPVVADGKTFSKTFSYALALKGDTGVSISSVTNYYLATSASSGVTTSTSGWTPTVQTMDATKQYLWNYEVVSGSDGSTLNTTTPVIIGRYGQNGGKGDTGRGITSITEHYQVSSSNSTAPTTWSDTMVNTTATNKYLWNYETITYTDGTTEDSTKRVIGTHGDKGDKGDRGATWYAGTGITGTSTTAKVFSGSGVASAIVGDHYLNTSTQNVYRCTVAGAASTAKWVYEQNIKGEHGAPGGKGDTGDTCYFHIKYSNDGGATFTGNSGEDAGSYIGTYSDNTEADSTSVSSYKWVKIEGDDGTSVTVSSIKYAVSSTESQPADSAFTYNSVPTVAEGRWLWTLTTYSNGSKAYTKAKQGQKGDAGTSVTVSSIKYAVTTTESQPADSAFTYNSVPTVAEGSWLWTLTTFSNGSKIYSKAKQGKAGTNGTTFTPSVDASGNISWTNDGGKTNPTAVNIKGPQGDKGDKGVGVTSITKTGTSGTVDTYTIKYTDNTSTTFTVTNGTNGTNGTSAEWFYGTALTHTSGTATATISGAKVGDMYLNTATSNVYKCTAKNVWTYAGNIADGVIDNISIGGRNLLGRTANPVVPEMVNSSANATFGTIATYNTGGKTFNIERFDDASNALVWTDSSTGNRGIAWYTGVGVVAKGETVTFSCMVKSSVATTIHTHTAWRNGSETATYTGWTSAGSKSIAANTWTKYEYTFQSASAFDEGEFLVAPCFTGVSTGATFSIAQAKLEKGNIATGWTPAPEDVQADIEAVQEAADEAQATADRKKQTFISTPTPPYYEGDAYFKTESGESGSAQWYVCTNTRLTAYGTGESWEDDFEPTSYALESSLQSTKTELLEEDKKIKASVEEQKTYTDGKVTPLETRTSTLEQAARDFTLTFNTEISGLKERTENNENDLSSYQKVFAFTENGLQISEQRDKIQTPSVLQIDNGKISFIVDGQEASYWSGENSMFYVGDIVVGLNKKAQFGNFAWIPRSNGNLSFRWVGSSEDNN